MNGENTDQDLLRQVPELRRELRRRRRWNLFSAIGVGVLLLLNVFPELTVALRAFLARPGGNSGASGFFIVASLIVTVTVAAFIAARFSPPKPPGGDGTAGGH